MPRKSLGFSRVPVVDLGLIRVGLLGWRVEFRPLPFRVLREEKEVIYGNDPAAFGRAFERCS